MLDAHISGSKVGRALGELGHDVKATERMERIPDDVLFELVAGEGRVFVTHNVKDFARILRQRPPEKSHSGLILIPHSVRLNEFGTMISGVQRTLRRLSQEDWVDRVEWMRKAKSS